jgi:hypothetical protein
VVEVDLVTAEADRLADAQTVTKHHEDQEMIPDPVPSGLGGIEQGGDFGLTQKILAQLVHEAIRTKKGSCSYQRGRITM